jgi:hypothetical protein
VRRSSFGRRGIGAAFAILIVTFAGLATVNVLVYARCWRTAYAPRYANRRYWADDPHRGGVLIAMGVLTATLRKAA